jgi:para-nitrobenzyl esterase
MDRKFYWAAVAACVWAFSPAAAADKPDSTVPASASAATIVMAPAFGEPTRRAKTKPACDHQSDIYAEGGVLCGLDGGAGTYVYKGIPYAQPPVGVRRWQPPLYVRPSAKEATEFGHVCPQDPSYGAATPDEMSEDCLYLNIWKPKRINAGSPVPVMVFIHGGAFVFGSGSAPVFDGSALASKGVIVVTFNYRLGALGFLTTDNVSVHGIKATGNYGFLDQQKALAWVHTNIEMFGGDRRRITIFGESAGAMSVGLHVFSAPMSNIYFDGAIAQSNPMATRYLTTGEAKRVSEKFLDAVCGASAPTCDPEPSAIVARQKDFVPLGDPLIAEGIVGFRTQLWAPVIDGLNVFRQPYLGYLHPDRPDTTVPLVMGVNRNEGAPFGEIAWGMAQQNEAAMTAFYNSQMRNGLQDPNAPDYLARESDRYKASAQPSPPAAPYGAHAGMFANVVTDFLFACGNEVAADAAATAPAPPVYAYTFNHPPSFDPGPSTVACQPQYNNVCHAAELKFVFGTLPETATPAERELSNSMMLAWTGFAKNPRNPQNGWRAYHANGAPARVFDTKASTADEETLDPNGVCPVWRGNGFGHSLFD